MIGKRQSEAILTAKAFFTAQVAPTAWVLYAQIDNRLSPVWPHLNERTIKGRPYMVKNGSTPSDPSIFIWKGVSVREIYQQVQAEFRRLLYPANSHPFPPFYALDGDSLGDGTEAHTRETNYWEDIDRQVRSLDNDLPYDVLAALPSLTDGQRLALLKKLLS